MNQQFNNSTSSLKIIREIGGIRYILSYLEIYIPYTILSIIGVILGIMGIQFFSNIYYYENSQRYFL